MTAYRQEEVVSRAVEAGVFGYLVKPFREDDLLPAIRTARARLEELTRRARRSPRWPRRSRPQGVERAKGLLMARRASPRRRRSPRPREPCQVTGRPLRVIAEAVVETLGG